ncbi:MAG: hypothetical protein CMN30_30430 [Sandaracinus sp.]|nr:hypothetical protein [Sandaracinus sp.]|tara:strand:+ start:112 stop:444 length:333 start_codon:yes stop_codon:yes gene_type:complete
MAKDDDKDSMLYAADEPTAMWGSDAVAALNLDEPPEAQQAGPATQGQGASPSSVELQLGAADAPHQPVGKPAPGLQPAQGKGSVLPWLITVVGAVLLAVGAFLLVRMLRG